MKVAKIIDLTQYWQIQTALQRQITYRTEALNNAKKALSDSDSAAQQDFISRIENGETTGDPLQDELLKHFGFSKDLLDGVLAFSQRLVAAKGKELLLQTTYEVRYRFGSEIRPGDIGTVHGYVLGILSGNPLIMNPPGCEELLDPHIVLPFERYVTMNHQDDRRNGTFSGPLRVSESHHEPSTHSLLHAIWKMSESYPSSDTGCHRILIFVGDEIPSGDTIVIDQKLIDISYLRKDLSTPTTEEKFQGEGI